MSLRVSQRPTCGRPATPGYVRLVPKGVYHAVLNGTAGVPGGRSPAELPEVARVLRRCGLTAYDAVANRHAVTAAGYAALSILDGGMEMDADTGDRQ